MKMEKKLQRRYLTYYNLLIVQDLSEEVHRLKSIYRHDDEKCKTFRIKYKHCDCFLELKMQKKFV